METDTGDYYAKPMNCPSTCWSTSRRCAATATCRCGCPSSGRSTGTRRSGRSTACSIRGGTQDDSHIICTPEQPIDEILAVFDLTLEIHRTFGFTDPVVELSTLPTGQSIVDEATAARATEVLTLALEKSGLDYRIAEGEGAFYGPRWTSTSATRSAACGSSPRSSATSRCPSASTWSTRATTTSVTGR